MLLYNSIPFSSPQTRIEIVVVVDVVIEIFCFLFISIAKYFFKINKIIFKSFKEYNK